MFTHDYIQPYQVNSFVYCKRKWYYQNRLNFFVNSDDLKIEKYVHKNHWLTRYKYKELYLVSHEKKIKGICDFLIEENGLYIPVEVKSGKCNASPAFKNDIMQLMCYILLLEDHFDIKYPHGYILYLGSKRKYKVSVSLALRKNVQKKIQEIRSYMRSKKIPKQNYDEKLCRNCSYHDYCWCE